MPTPGRRRVRVLTSSATSWLWLRGDAPPARDWSFRCDSAALRSRLRVWHQVKGRFPRQFLFRVERARLILREGPAVRIPPSAGESISAREGISRLHTEAKQLT